MLKTLVTLIFAASALAAQEPPPAPAVIAQFLGFSDSQTVQFLGAVQGLQNRIGPLQQQAAAAQQSLDQLVNSDNPDPAALGARLLAVRAIQKQILAALDSYHKLFVSLLTTGQMQKVQAVAQAGELLPAVNAFAHMQLLTPPQ
ncbi:MAG TPA: hypothetical protein VGZ73_12510 [Bryobacteraceae bacterium]|nr:hypothetical protein [Bryobacteraceae bacterium]